MNFLLPILAALDPDSRTAVRTIVIVVVVMAIAVVGAMFSEDGFAKRVIIALGALIALLVVLFGFDII